MSSLVFVTGNASKAKEAQQILGVPVIVQTLELNEIQSLDLDDIARKKAEDAYRIVQKPLIVDDVGLYISAWNRFPGPFIKYLLAEGGNELLLKMLHREKNTSATVICTIGYHDGNTVHVLRGEVTGKIVEPRGEGGWGFDPVFEEKTTGKTFAEMGIDQKNKLSHRFRALEALKEFLLDKTL